MFRRPGVRACAIVVVLVGLPTGPRADDRCAVPLADWQPREALIAELERSGWTILKIRVDDGCYKVMATDRDGRVVKARFDPSTLERVEGGDHGERHGSDHGRDDDRN